MNKLRWGKFYWSDWSDDPALASCSMPAQGLWMRLLCIAAQGTPYGHVTINGTAPDLATLAKLVRARPGDLTRWIAELERKGVAARGECGCLISRRMVHDGQITAVRRAAAETSWRGSNVSDSEATRESLGDHSQRNDFKKTADFRQNPKNLHMQTGSFASTELEEEKESRVPPNPPNGGAPPGGRRRAGRSINSTKPSRNAACDIAAEMLHLKRGP